MKTFAERLKIALKKRGLSQAQAARNCGIAQQSLNYIINKNLPSSKLAPLISSALNINPEWLISGKGKFEETRVYEIPIFHSIYMLKKFLDKNIDTDSMNHTLIEIFLGNQAFAYLIDPNEMLICCVEHTDIKSNDKNIAYLNIENNSINVSNIKGNQSFPIFERRFRHVIF